jgi:hypothetical protein
MIRHSRPFTNFIAKFCQGTCKKTEKEGITLINYNGNMKALNPIEQLQKPQP